MSGLFFCWLLADNKKAAPTDGSYSAYIFQLAYKNLNFGRRAGSRLG